MVVTLKPEAWLDPAALEATAEPVMRELLERVAKKSGVEPGRVQMFPNIGALNVSASPSFMEHLAREPEVLRADQNLQEESMKIEPIRKRSVTFGSSRKKP